MQYQYNLKKPFPPILIEEIGNACDPSSLPTSTAKPKPKPTAKPTPPPNKCTKTCEDEGFAKDKFCDDGNNNCGCKWDGGDCCGPNNDYQYCKECKCKDPKSKFKGQIKGKA